MEEAAAAEESKNGSDRLPCHPDVLGKQCEDHAGRQKESERKKGGEREERDGELQCTRIQRERESENRDTGRAREICPWARLALSWLGPPPSATDRDDAATLHQPYVVFIAAGPPNTICDLHPSRGILEFNNGRLCRERVRRGPSEQPPRLLFLFLYIV